MLFDLSLWVVCERQGSVMPRLFVWRLGNMEVHRCLGGDIKVNVVGIAAIRKALAVDTGLDVHVAWVDS